MRLLLIRFAPVVKLLFIIECFGIKSVLICIDVLCLLKFKYFGKNRHHYILYYITYKKSTTSHK